MTTHKLKIKNNRKKIIPSFSFKFLLALLIVAIVPVGVSFFIFEQISDFNQKLQKEAVDSIDGVSEIYKSYMRNESERILLLQRNISLEIEHAWHANHATSLRDLLYNENLQRDIQAIFDDAIAENRNFFDIRLTVNRLPIVKATSDHIDSTSYAFHAAATPIRILDNNLSTALPPLPSANDADDAMMIVETHLVAPPPTTKTNPITTSSTTSKRPTTSPSNPTTTTYPPKTTIRPKNSTTKRSKKSPHKKPIYNSSSSSASKKLKLNYTNDSAKNDTFTDPSPLSKPVKKQTSPISTKNSTSTSPSSSSYSAPDSPSASRCP